MNDLERAQACADKMFAADKRCSMPKLIQNSLKK